MRKAVDRISGFLAQIAMWGVVAMMLLVVIDVAMRALLNRSTLVADELGGYLLVLIAYLGMAEAYRLGRHIRVDIATRRFSERVRIWLDMVFCPLGFVALCIVLWRSVIMVHRSRAADVIIPGVLLTPVYLPQILILVGLSAMALQCIVDLFGCASALRRLSKGSAAGTDKEAIQS